MSMLPCSLPFSSPSNPTSRSASLIRRPLPIAILVLVSLSLIYSFTELPLERLSNTFSPRPLASDPSLTSEAHQLDSDFPSAATQQPPIKPKHEKHLIVNGLLELDLELSALQHPIYQLVDEAKVEWEDKVKRQSKTLVEAVEEYKRRNGGRSPPLGFDRWWDYVVKNKVGLVDEYDMINRDINPYRGYSPKTLKHRMKQLQTHQGIPPELLAGVKDTFSLTIVNGTLTKHSFTFDPESIYGSADRAQGQFDLIKDVAQWIPDMTAVLSIQDTPSQFVSWSHLEELRRLTEEEEYWDEEDNEADQAFDGWGSACPPSTPLYQRSLEISLAPVPHVHDPSVASYNDEDPNDLDFSYPHVPGAYVPPVIDAEHLKHPPPAHRGKPKSFISSHTEVMDVCMHPDTVDLHGATAGLRPAPAKVLMPIFSLSKTKLHSDITVIPIEQWGEDAGALHWLEKEESRMLWRGRNTGMRYSNSTPWRSSHRARLAYQASYERNATIDILPPPRIIAEAMSLDVPPASSSFDITRAREGEKEEEVANEKRAKRAPTVVIDRGWSLGDVVMGLNQGELNERLYDVGLAFEAIQCVVEDGTCADIERELQFLPVKTFSEENHYRYILDIDGNAWSARMQRLLHSNAAIIKSTIFPEWWNDRVQPWVHYIPAKMDYEDLYDINSFFQGDGRSSMGEDEIGRGIAEAGRNWSLENWRRVDMTAYMFRLYLEWARLLAHDRSTADFILSETRE